MTVFKCLQDSHCPTSGNDGVTGCNTDNYVCCDDGQEWNNNSKVCEPYLAECTPENIGKFFVDATAEAGWRYCCEECALGYSYHCWYGTIFYNDDNTVGGGGGGVSD